MNANVKLIKERLQNRRKSKKNQILKSAILIIFLFILSVVVFFIICTGTRTFPANSSNAKV